VAIRRWVLANLMLENDHRDQLFAPLRIGQAQHGAVGHRGVAGQQVFDLGRVDVLAAGYHHVLGTAHHGVAAIGRLARQVAAVEPALAIHRRHVGPVVANHVRRAQQQFAHAVAHTGQAHLDAGRRPAAGTRVAGSLVRPQGDGKRTGLGGTVDVAQRHTARQEGLNQRGGQRAGAGPDRAQARQVGAGPRRMLDQRLHRCRHLQRERRALGRECLQRGAGVEAPVQQHTGAGVQRRQRLDAQAADVEQRQHRQHAVVRRDGLGFSGGRHVGQQIGLRMHGALGPAGGA